MKKFNLRKAFWYLVLALPVLAYIFALWGGNAVSFADVASQFALPLQDSVVGSTISGIFGADGVLPLVTADFMAYFNYFVGVELIHITIDVLLFLPTLLQKCWERLDRERDS